MTDHVATVRDYYRSLDEDDYDLLADILAPGFVHERSDMTLDGRERFVQFMREERPMKDTTHPLDAVYERTPNDQAAGTTEVAARGRLLKPDGSRLVSFVDVFRFEDAEIEKLRTYTH